MAYTRKEAARTTAQENVLMSLGFTRTEADTLRRISRALRRWHELECGVDNGAIERDDDTQRPYWCSSTTGRRYPVADRERGALKRLQLIMRDVNGRRPERASFVDNLRDDMSFYVQTDPRGAALYILRPSDVPAGADPASYYTRGICVY